VIIMKARITFVVLVGIAFVLGVVTARRSGSAATDRMYSIRQAEAAGQKGPVAATERTEPPGGPSAEQLRASVQRLAQNITSAAGWDELLKALAAWAAIDPKAALDYVKSFAPERQHSATSAILSVWTKHDPKAAWKWASEKDPANAPYIDAVLTELGKTNADLAWSFADKFARDYPHAAEYAYTNALMGIIHSGNFEDAVALIQQVKLPASPDRLTGQYQLADALASHWARFEPEKAAAWVRSWPEGIAQRHVLMQVSQAWSEADPERAAEFAKALPPGDLRKMAVTQTVTSWLANEPGKASEWMDRYEPSPDFDNAVYVLATAPGTLRNPDTAISWADSITDRELRLQALHTILTDWAKRDRAAVTEYLSNTTQLPAETRTQFLTEIKGDR
jgi:hypothetical protein